VADPRDSAAAPPVHPADFYDLIYGFKDYAGETAHLHHLIRRYGRAPGRQVVDVGCGTGTHLGFLRNYGYEGAGVDASPEMIAVARRRYPGIPFTVADMVEFSLPGPVAAVLCLFNAIACVQTQDRLAQTLAGFYGHLAPGGVALVEPWFTPTTAAGGNFTPLVAQNAAMEVARLTEHQVVGGCSHLKMHYLVKTAAGVQYLHETYIAALFTPEDYHAAFAAAGFTPVHYEPHGLTGSGLYIACRP
jgi:SAM-dependent methyltransferase